MRYRIEYLRESTDEASVCTWRYASGESFDQAIEQARSGRSDAQQCFGAQGFHIRDVGTSEIAFVEAFDED